MMLKRFEAFLLNTLKNPRHKKTVLWLTLLAFVLSVAMIPSMLVLAKMLPGKNNDTFTIYVDLPSGSSIDQTRSVSECVIKQLQTEQEITDMELFLGAGAPLDFAGLVKGSHFKNSESQSEIVVNLQAKHHRQEDSFTMVQRIRPLITEACEKLYQQTSIKFIEPPAGPPVLSAIVAEIYGDNAEGIRHLAQQVKTIFTQTDGLVDIDIMQDEIYEQVQIRVDTIKIARSGLSVKQVNEILYLAFEGMQIAVKNSSVYDDQIPIYLSLSTQTKRFSRHDLNAVQTKLASLKLMNAKGYMVPVTELITLKYVPSNPMIISKDLHHMSNVMAETDMVSQVYPLMHARKQIIQTLSDEYTITTDGLFDLSLKHVQSGKVYRLVWDGEMKVTLDTFVDLGGAFIAALVLIFLLMVLYYKSFALSGIVLLGSFLSIIGVLIGHFIMDLFTPQTFFLTATSLVGFISLIGISSRNSLLLLDFTKSLILNKGMPQKEAIAFATATRAKPIFLTAAAIILASTLLASDAVFGGLGVALIFGTIAAVIASLLVVPVLMDYNDLAKAFSKAEENEDAKA